MVIIRYKSAKTVRVHLIYGKSINNMKIKISMAITLTGILSLILFGCSSGMPANQEASTDAKLLVEEKIYSVSPCVDDYVAYHGPSPSVLAEACALDKYYCTSIMD